MLLLLLMLLLLMLLLHRHLLMARGEQQRPPPLQQMPLPAARLVTRITDHKKRCMRVCTQIKPQETALRITTDSYHISHIKIN